MAANDDLLDWLCDACGAFELEGAAIFRKEGSHPWPLTAVDPDDLKRKLEEGGHFLPLPTEPAALANIVEVALVDFVVERAAGDARIVVRRGTERGYPDIEISGSRFGGGFHAVDVKVAKRGKSGRQTQSRITLYTGNTYFRYPQLSWPGTFRPFGDYASHVDLLGIYTLDLASKSRIADLDVIVAEPWRIASKQRSSTTREYIGAVKNLTDLKAGNGEFATEDDFYKYWRRFPFKIGAATQKQLDKLLAQRDTSGP